MRNRLRKYALGAVGAVVVLLSQQGAANAQGEIRIAGPDFPPYYEMADGRLDGILTRILSAIIENGGYRWSGTVLPAARLMSEISEGRSHASLLVMNKTLEDNPSVMRSPEPITEVVLNVYSANKPFQVTSRENLRGHSIIVMRGYGYGGLRTWLDDPANNITLLEANNFASTIAMLRENRAPLALLYDVNYDAGIKQLGKQPENIFTNNFLRVPAYIYLSKSVSEDPKNTMDELIASYRDLLSKGILSPPKNRPEGLKKIAKVDRPEYPDDAPGSAGRNGETGRKPSKNKLIPGDNTDAFSNRR